MNHPGLVHAGILLALFSLARAQTAPSPQSISIEPAQSDQSLKQKALVPENRAPDKLFDLPPLRQSGASLMGGALESIDRVRDRFVLRPFGQGKVTIAFDPRTQFLRGENTARAQEMRPGDRVYVETVLDGTTVFAKTVHLPTDAVLGAVTGQVISYDAARGNLSIRDQLSSEPAKFRLTTKTIITGAGVAPGALVQLSFLPGEAPPSVRELRVLIAPGSIFTFTGRITFLDLGAQELVLASATDNNRYEIRLSPAAIEGDTRALMQEGANVTIAARFNGQGYVAESVAVLAPSGK